MDCDEIQVRNRCAIYTRKSTNQLLERDLNSLVTQREVCSAYVTSQRLQGWMELPQRYDDGGHSGTGLERPALVKLMADIEEGLIDTVVVYKIDRLTRSLTDFVQILDIFNKRDISLVSISQSFDTSSSMGRMILNILLTFSQFERELISERIRDSIRTRKSHGETHGSLPPIGYIRSPQRGLQIVEDEAEIVRFVFGEFLRTQKYTTVLDAVQSAGLKTSIKHLKSGKARGGKAIGHGAIYRILHNPIYVGEVHGHAGTYTGRHEPIISRETWEAAQALTEARKRPPPKNKLSNHLLMGLLWDDHGRHMVVEVCGARAKQQFTYTSSYARWSKAEGIVPYRCNPDYLDKLILATVSNLLLDRRKLREALKTLGLGEEELDHLTSRGRQVAGLFEECPAEWRKDILTALLSRIEIGLTGLTLIFRRAELRRLLIWKGSSRFRVREADWACSSARYELKLDISVVSPKVWPVLNVAPRSITATGTRNEALVSVIKKARRAQRLLEANRTASIRNLAKRMNTGSLMFTRLLRLNYLAPDIITAILDGTQPITLQEADLLEANFPMDWAIQRKLFGFDLARRTIESHPFGQYSRVRKTKADNRDSLGKKGPANVARNKAYSADP